MLHQFSHAINPTIRLGNVLRNWPSIAHDLAEPSRRRSKQMKGLCSLIF
jgi:hypothetical protein